MPQLVPIYRHDSTNPDRYAYDTNPLGEPGWSEGVIAFYAYLSKEEGTVPIYRHRASRNPERYFFDTEPYNASGWGQGEIAFYAHATPALGTLPIFRHHALKPWRYYYDTEAHNAYGWTDDGVAFHAYAFSTDDTLEWWCQDLSWNLREGIAGASNKRAAFQRGVLWSWYTTITYSVEGSRSRKNHPEREQIIDAAFAEWNSVGMNITFKKIDSWEGAVIRVGNDAASRDNSSMGTDALRKAAGTRTMNLPMLKGLGEIGHTTALHEIGHAIGLLHEHQRVDSGIIWNKPATYDWFAFEREPAVTDRTAIDKNVFAVDKDFQPSAPFDSQFPYDSKSVMNYDFPAKCFKAPPELQRDGIVRSTHLTKTDIATARYFYPPEKVEP